MVVETKDKTVFLLVRNILANDLDNKYIDTIKPTIYNSKEHWFIKFWYGCEEYDTYKEAEKQLKKGVNN